MSAADKAKLDALGSGPTTPGHGIVIPRLNVDPIEINDVTQTADGVMSAADKAKLDGFGSIPDPGAPLKWLSPSAQPQFIPGASPIQAGLMSAADKVKLDALTPIVPKTWKRFTIPTLSGGLMLAANTETEAYTSDGRYIAKWNGAAWTMVHDFGATTTIRALSCPRFFPNNVLFAVGATSGVGHIWRSTDGGATWTLKDIPDASNVVSAVFLDGSNLFIAAQLAADVTHSWLYRSGDNGTTWTFSQVTPGKTTSMFGTAPDLYFTTDSDQALKRIAYTGSTITTIYTLPNVQTPLGIWPPFTGDIFIASDTPTAPNSQMTHFFNPTAYADVVPIPAPGPGAPNQVQLRCVYGVNVGDPSPAYAGGQGFGTFEGTEIFSTARQINDGPTTWVKETLPAPIAAGVGGIYGIFIDDADNNVLAVGVDGNGVAAGYFYS